MERSSRLKPLYYPAFAKWQDLRQNGGTLDNRHSTRGALATFNTYPKRNSAAGIDEIDVLAPFFGSTRQNLEGIRQGYTCPHVAEEFEKQFGPDTRWGKNTDGDGVKDAVQFPYASYGNMMTYQVFHNYYRSDQTNYGTQVPMPILGEPWQVGRKLGGRLESSLSLRYCCQLRGS